MTGSFRVEAIGSWMGDLHRVRVMDLGLGGPSEADLASSRGRWETVLKEQWAPGAQE